MLRATEMAHLLVAQSLGSGDWAVDATVGNGHDTLFLAGQVGVQGRVFGFDVQEDALAATGAKVEGLAQVTLLASGHEHMAARLPAEAREAIAVVMFNLGYLPGAARELVTRKETTLAALEQALMLLRPGGLVTLVLYTGHPGGAEEAAAVRGGAERLPKGFAAMHAARLNTAGAAPELLAIERRA